MGGISRTSGFPRFGSLLTRTYNSLISMQSPACHFLKCSQARKFDEPQSPFSAITIFSFDLLRFGLIRLPCFLVFTFALSCSDPLPTTLNRGIAVTIEDVSCTEAWLKIVSTGISHPTIELLRNDSLVDRFVLAQAETTWVDEGLLPSKTYTYAIRSADLLGVTWLAAPAQVRTMDTTSNEFTWEVTTLGDAGSSVLYDVAIINDTLAYAVGEIYVAGEPTRYNAAKWNGQSWKIQRIPYNYGGVNYYHPIQGVFAFAPDDIWFCGNGVSRWDGTRFIEMPLPASVWGAYQMNRMWGISRENIYVVGDGGSIAHYDGTNWRKVESGTELDFNDIHGVTKAGTTNVYAVASDIFRPSFRRLLSIKGLTVDSIPTPAGDDLLAVSALSSCDLFVGGRGLWRNHHGAWLQTSPFSQNIVISICGNAVNDVSVAGTFGFIAHFNGESWRTYENVTEATMARVRSNGKLLVVVGASAGSAKVIMGRSFY